MGLVNSLKNLYGTFYPLAVRLSTLRYLNSELWLPPLIEEIICTDHVCCWFPFGVRYDGESLSISKSKSPLPNHNLMEVENE